MTSTIEKPQRLLRITEVMTRIGMGKSAIYAGIQEGTFPQPIKLSVRAVCWPESEIENWIFARISGKKLTYEPKQAKQKIPLKNELSLTSCALKFQWVNGVPEVVTEHGSQDGPAYFTGKQEIVSAANFLIRCARSCK